MYGTHMANTRQIQGNRMAHAWHARHGKDMSTAWEIHGKCIVNTLRKYGKYRATEWQRYGKDMATAWQIQGNNITHGEDMAKAL